MLYSASRLPSDEATMSAAAQPVTKRDILHLLQANAPHIRALGVRRIGLFGSFARDQQADQSDIDLIVEFEPERKNFDVFMQLSFFLEDLLGRRVELVTTEALSPYLGPHILNEAVYADLAA
jgi:uncharacterized protein